MQNSLAITGLLGFFLERPVVATVSASMLLYSPALLDILPTVSMWDGMNAGRADGPRDGAEAQHHPALHPATRYRLGSRFRADGNPVA